LNTIINADLVYWITSGGALPRPFNHWMTEKELDKLLKKTNGLVIQGNQIGLNINKEYEQFVRKLITKVKLLNDYNTFYPIFAIGQGMDALMVITANDNNLFTYFPDHLKNSTKLFFHDNPIKSKYKLYKMFGKKEYKYFFLKPSNILDLFYGLETESFKNNKKISNEYIYTSYGRLKDGRKYVTSIEHKNYPIYGIEFHPEEPAYNLNQNENIRYTKEVFAVSNKILTFIVEESRQSSFSAKMSHIHENHRAINILATLPISTVNEKLCWSYTKINERNDKYLAKEKITKSNPLSKRVNNNFPGTPEIYPPPIPLVKK